MIYHTDIHTLSLRKVRKNMTDYAYYNGEYAPYSDIRLPLSDRAIFFGDGVYDVMLGYRKRIHGYARHISRLMSNARHISLASLPSEVELCRIIAMLIEYSHAESYILYIQLSRSGHRRAHVYSDAAQTNLLITLTEFVPRLGGEPISLITRPDIRYRMCNIKTLNLLPSVIAANEAAERGADETVLIRNGRVTECSHSNIIIMKNEKLYTHPCTDVILPGITRADMLSAAREMGLTVYKTPFGLSELMSADEIIVTSTTALGRRAAFIDGVPCGMRGGETAERLLAALKKDYLNSIDQ